LSRLTVASDKQIAANRRNALKSTGPKTKAGKRAVSRNAYRHGLSALANFEQSSEATDSLARSIAAGSTNEIIFYHARIAARAHLDLARIAQLKKGLIKRALWGPAYLDPVGWSPSELEEREAEAILLPELRELDRYERRARSMRDRALREVVAAKRHA
jgi:hypothetical protein